MKTYRLIHKTKTSCEFKVNDDYVHIHFSGSDVVKIIPIAAARQQYVTMLASRQWMRDPVETALEAIATLNYSAMREWLLSMGGQPSDDDENNLLWVAGIASAAPFAPTDVRRNTLRRIRARAITGATAATMAAAVL